jgi:hypothetical protein
MSDSLRPSFRKPISDSAKGWTGIIMGITGLVTALGALTHEPEEKAAKQSYEVLSHRVEQQDEMLRQMQSDMRQQGEWLANLRGYVQGAQQASVVERPAGRRGRPEPPPMPTEVRVLPPPPKPKAPTAAAKKLPSFEQIEQQVKK